MHMLVIKNGTLLPMNSKTLNADILIEEGKIAAIEKDVSTGTADVIDASGCFVTPGLIDAHSHMGLMQTGTPDRDHNELSDPIAPELRAIDAINPFDAAFAAARSSGMTTCITGPGSINLIGGAFAAIKTAGTLVDDMVLRNPVAIKMALGENPKLRYSEQNKSPRSRMAEAAIIRKALVRATEYLYAMRCAAESNDKARARDLAMEALLPVLSRELPLKIHVHRADDIATAVRIADEFNVRYTLDHCTEGYLVTDLLKKALAKNCQGIIVGPLISYSGKYETARKMDFKIPVALYESGIPFAICTDYYENPVELLRVCAALSAAEGLPPDEALKAITINAAKIAGISDRVGSLAVGKDADIAVFSGDPIDCRSRCLITIIDGDIVYKRSDLT